MHVPKGTGGLDSRTLPSSNTRLAAALPGATETPPAGYTEDPRSSIAPTPSSLSDTFERHSASHPFLPTGRLQLTPFARQDPWADRRLPPVVTPSSSTQATRPSQTATLFASSSGQQTAALVTPGEMSTPLQEKSTCPEGPGFDPSLEGSEAAVSEPRGAPNPKRRRARPHPPELINAFLEFWNQLPPRTSDRAAATRFNAKFNTSVNHSNVRHWVRMRGKSNQAQAFIEFYLRQPNSEQSKTTTKVLKEFNKQYNTNIDISLARDWVNGHLLRTGQTTEQRRAHFLEFYKKQSEREYLPSIVARYNETAPLAHLVVETARYWINCAQNSTQQRPQSSRQPAGATNQPKTSTCFPEIERAHEPDIGEEAASTPAQSGNRATREEMTEGSSRDDTLFCSAPALYMDIDSDELWAEVDFVEKGSSSMASQLPAPLQPSSEHVADPSEKQASADEEEPLNAPPIEDFLSYVASAPSDPLLSNMVIDSDELLADVDFVEKGSSSTVGPLPAPPRPSSEHVADPSERQANADEEEPLNAPPIEDFRSYIASNPSDPLLAGFRLR